MLIHLILVEQMGVEPTTYTMRTYRSSQLSYCPLFQVYRLIYTRFGFCQAVFRFRLQLFAVYTKYNFLAMGFPAGNFMIHTLTK